jgi:thymidylate synthase
MNNLDKQYTDLLQDILDNGTKKETRNGGTISVFGRQIRHKMSDGFPLLTTKKMPFKTIVTELLWFLRGDTNIKYLVDNDTNIWNGDAYKNYLKECNEDKWMKEIVLDLPFPNKSYGLFTQEEFINKIKTDDEFAKEWGDLGPIYGKQWRSWPTYSVGETTFKTGIYTAWRNEADQIANLINDLKTNPDSRRLMVNAWNVGELDQMVLPPCHFSFQCYSHEKEGKRYLSLAWNQRSCDVGLGIPFNIASYGLLLEIIAKEVGMIPYELIGNLGDCHIYNNHIDGLKEQLTREPHPLPKICLDYREGEYNKDLTDLISDDFVLFDYQSHPSIKLPLSN